MPTVQVKDYYRTLGVARDADEKSIRAAYRKLARQHHPDINPGDKAAEERFKEINEASEVLTSADKRKLYDRFGEDWQRYRDAGFTGDETRGRAAGAQAGFDPNDFASWFAGQGGQPGRPTTNARPGAAPGGTGSGRTEDWTFYQVEDDGGGFSDFFHTLFGGGRGRAQTAAPSRTRRRRGEDTEVGVDVSFDEAFRGATRMIALQTPHPCPTCGGTGLARGATCPPCDGSGVTLRAKTIEVSIPAGVATGSRVRIAGQGGVGEGGGGNGDVYLRIAVRPDGRFEREGDDLRVAVEVPLTTAVLGGEVVVPTPTGRVALTVPAETQPDRVFRLRGLGMPRLRDAKGERGDLLARARVNVPTNLSERERELFAELRRLRGEGG